MTWSYGDCDDKMTVILTLSIVSRVDRILAAGFKPSLDGYHSHRAGRPQQTIVPPSVWNRGHRRRAAASVCLDR